MLQQIACCSYQYLDMKNIRRSSPAAVIPVEEFNTLLVSYRPSQFAGSAAYVNHFSQNKWDRLPYFKIFANAVHFANV